METLMKTCPLWRGPCKEHGCRWYIQLLGMHPQTGAQQSEWGCAIEFMPVLLIENAKETRQAAAAVESSRNQASTDAASVTGALLHVAEAARSAMPARTVPALGMFSRLRLAFKKD